MNDYHDAQLNAVTFNWTTGLVTIHITLCRTPKTEVALSVEDARSLVVPREAPWGRSFYINKLVTHRDVEFSRLEVEMQSGDVVVVEGKSISEPARTSEHVSQ